MKQKDLSRLLVSELKALGIEDVELDSHGYVYATLPSNTDKQVPTICFCSHVDTSPDSSGKDVKPIIHENLGVLASSSRVVDSPAKRTCCVTI